MDQSLVVRTPSQLVVRNHIDGLQQTMESEIAKGDMVQTIVDCIDEPDQASHYYGEGIYARALLIPAGTCVIGHIHKYNRICIIAQGNCTFVDEWQKKTVDAPYIGEFKAGSKTAVYAHTDTLWVACVSNKSNNTDQDMSDFVETSHEDYQLYLEQLEEK